MFYKKSENVGLERWLAVKSTCCSCRGPGFTSQSLTVGPTIPNFSSRESSAVCWPLKIFTSIPLDMHVAHIYTCRQNGHRKSVKIKICFKDLLTY